MSTHRRTWLIATIALMGAGGASCASTRGPVGQTTLPAPALVGTCSDGAVQEVYTLIAHATPCPPCPPLATCEACAPEYELYAGEDQSAWVAPAWFGPPTLEHLAAIEPGTKVLLCGALEAVSEPGASQVLRLQGLQVLP